MSLLTDVNHEDTFIEDTVPEHPEAMESTCNDLPTSTSHQQALPELSRISSTVSAQDETLDVAEDQHLRVYLRVRPFSENELSDGEDQGCVVINNSQTVSLLAPKGSASLKSSEKGIGTSLHKFSFSKIFGPETMQLELFEGTIKSQVSDYLKGSNALIFCYGVTNAGKTFTIQGTPKEPGILPRVLDGIFQYIGGRQYEDMALKPYLGNDAQYLAPDQVRQERSTKSALFARLKEECELRRGSGDSCESSTPSALSLSFSSLACDQTAEVEGSSAEAGSSSQFALWVAFYEIYNEYVYDLLQPPTFSKSKRRTALRVCEDNTGNSYVRDLKWINIQNLEEASKLLRVGNKNRSAASTKMNQSSSRSHSIFTMKLLKIDGLNVQRISELSLCDLAGSERCNKTKTFGDRLKEAANINTSLLILGKCIAALRNSRSDRAKSSYIPFRESKLTRLFQAIFCGKGRASMIVNINQCASTYDETLHVMKFSAIAKQVVQVIPTKALEALTPRLVGRDGKLLVRDGLIDSQALEGYLSEDELMDEGDEADMSILPQEELVNVVENLRTKLMAERRKNLVQEIEIRKEMGDAMLQLIMESEELRSRQMAELTERHQEQMENTFEMYKDALKEHAYQCAMNRVEDDYVPLDEFIAEQEKVEALRCRLSELQSQVSTKAESAPLPILDHSCQTHTAVLVQSCTQTEITDADRCQLLYKEKCAVAKLCEDRHQMILSLERRLAGLTETFQDVRSGLRETSAQLEATQREAEDQAKALDGLLKGNANKDQEIALLKKELAKLSQKSPVKTKSKRGLLDNIREAVTSPRTTSIGKTLRRTTRGTALQKNKSSV